MSGLRHATTRPKAHRLGEKISRSTGRLAGAAQVLVADAARTWAHAPWALRSVTTNGAHTTEMIGGAAKRRMTMRWSCVTVLLWEVVRSRWWRRNQHADRNRDRLCRSCSRGIVSAWSNVTHLIVQQAGARCSARPEATYARTGRA